MMDNLISRQEAIDVIYAWCKYSLMDVDAIIEDIKALPSAQKWIPCSERLPDEDYCTVSGIYHSAEVLATVINHGADEEIFVDMFVTVDGEWKMVHPIDGANRIADWCEVVAWMPLPEPYKEEE